MTHVNLDHKRKGRGAVSNRAGRFESADQVPYDDGWGTLDREPPARLVTTVTEDLTRTVIVKNKSPDIPFDYSLNPYRGCEHGCIYCYARPSHAFLGFSSGLDFETRLLRKSDAAQLLAKELRKPRYQCKTIVIGSNTDAYQPIERESRITRQILQTAAEFHQPIALITKSALVLRDLDILAPLAQKNLATVAISVTTLQPSLARLLEPRAAAPHRRIDVIRQLAEAGVPVTVNAAPMIPALNDNELEAILQSAHEAGAQAASYILLRLPLEVRDLFVEWLQSHFPNRAGHVMSLVRDTRDGAEYRSEFGTRMRGTGAYAALLKQRFQIACKRLGFAKRSYDLDTSLFKPPPAPGDQLNLFD